MEKSEGMVDMKRDRVARLREKMLALPSLCFEKGYLMTQSYKETEGEPHIIRRAKSLKKILEEMSIAIEDGELIVGAPSSKLRGGPLLPEMQWEWYLQELDTISTRDWDRFNPLTEDDKTTIKEFLPYWKGKSLYDRWCAEIPDELLKLNHKIMGGGAYCNNNMGGYGHIAADFPRVLKEGLNGVKRQVDTELGTLILAELKDFRKYQFLTAVKITLDAASIFARRYAKLSRDMAAAEIDSQRKTELEKIAEHCFHVPDNPARSFWEALQSVWFVYMIVMIEAWGPGGSYGRPDQYLLPYYEKDLADGILSRAQARELLALLLIRSNSFVTARNNVMVKTFAGYAQQVNITLGGLTPGGRDAVNDLSYLFLEAEEDVRLNQEDIVIRIHKNTPDAFVIKACETAKLIRGKLKFVSDETTIQQLLSDGKALEHSRDYHITGCNTPGIPARSLDIPGGILNLPLMVELALNDGISRVSGEQLGPRTGDPGKFGSFDDVWNAFKTQVDHLLPKALVFKNVDKKLFSLYAQTPFQSALHSGCIEKGLDITEGGTAPYVTHAISLGGSPNAGDSLAAVKKAVFEEHRITMDELIDALDHNFEGYEKIRRILSEAPKFGNDDDYVDSILNEILLYCQKKASEIKGLAGAISNVAVATITANIPLGYVVGALPDGRKAGEPLSEGGISPHQGRNVNGPVATMRSVAKLDLARFTNGSVLNMKFNPDALSDIQKIRRLASLIRTFCETGGTLVQFNIVGSDTLRDAQKHPEAFRDLLVRVATYSAYFVELSPELQNDIIARVEFEEV